MNPLLRLLFPLVLLAGFATADDKPAWPVIAETERLVAKHALFLPGGDGFLKRRDGRLLQFGLPEYVYSRDGNDWLVEIQSLRKRKESVGKWEAWEDASPRFSAWRMGVIRVKVPLSGVVGEWVDQSGFAGCTPPSESEVRHRLDTLGQNSVATYEGTPAEPMKRSAPATRSQPSVTRSSRHEPLPAHGGIFKKDASGALKRAWPPVPSAANAKTVALNQPPASQAGNATMHFPPPVMKTPAAGSNPAAQTSGGEVSFVTLATETAPSQGFSRRFMIAMIVLAGLVVVAAVVSWFRNRKTTGGIMP